MASIRPFILLCLLIACFNTVAQNISNQSITWTSSSLLEKHSNENVPINVEIRTIQSDRVEVEYPNEVLAFTIDSIEGQWADPAVNGELIYHVKSGGVSPGKITIRRNGNLTIDVDFTEANDYGLHQVFNVSGFNVE
jgi:hypothetical protein